MTTEAQAQAFDIPARFWPLVLGAASLAAILLVLVATATCGPGISPDSVIYVDAARNIAAGEGPVATGAAGQTELVATWPPLFPGLLAVGILLGLDAAEATRWLNALAHGGLCVLLGLVASRVSGRRLAGAIAAWLAALSPSLLRYAGFALSEPVFLLLMLAALLSLLSTGRKWMAVAGVLIGLACMQRYAGYGLIAGALAWLTLQRRWRDTCVFALAALPLPLIWRVWMWLATSGVDARSVSEGGVTGLHVRSLAHSISTWLVPETTPVALRAAVAGLLVLVAGGGLAWAVRKRAQPALLLAGLGAGIGCVLAVTVLLLDHELQPEPRMLLPLLPLAIVAMSWAIAARSGRVRLAGVALAGLLALSFGARDAGVIAGLREGEGYAAPAVRDSPTLRAALALPADAAVFANNPQPIIYHGARPARTLPLSGTFDYLKPAGTPPYADMGGTLARLKAEDFEGGYVVWFGEVSDEQLRELGLIAVAVYQDGGVYEPAPRRK